MKSDDYQRGSGLGGASDAASSELARLARPVEDGLLDVDALRRALDVSLAKERGLLAFLRSRSTPVRVGIAVCTIGALVLLAAIVFHRPDMSVYPPARMALAVGWICALLATMLAFGLRPVQLPAHASFVTPVAVWTSIVGLFALYLLPAAHVSHPASVLRRTGLQFQLLRATPCLVIGVVLGLSIYALLAALDRGGNRRGPMLAVASGLAANLVLQLLCPVTAPLHMLIGHLGTALLLLLATAHFWRREV